MNLRDHVVLNEIKEIQGERDICFCKKTVFMKERAEEKAENLWSQFLFSHWVSVECK